MPKNGILLFIFCLLFLLPLSVSAQDATATPEQRNCAQATSERSLVSGLFLSETIAPTETKAYYLLMTEENLFWRFDLSSIDAVTVNFFAPLSYRATLSFNSNPSSIYSTVFRTYSSGMACFYVSNPTEFTMQYNLRLTLLRPDEEHFPGTEGLSTSEGYILLGDYFYFSGNYESALEYYTFATESNAGDANAWAKRCSALFYLAFYEEALESCNEALEYNNDLETALFYRALSSESLGYYGSAFSDYQILDSNNRYNSLYSFGLATSSMFLGDATTALDAMNRYYERSDVWYKGYWRGVARLYAGDYEGAISDFETVILQAQGNPFPIYFMLGVTHRALGNRAEMEAAFSNAGFYLQQEGNPVFKQRWLALSLLLGGDAAAAQAHYREMLRLEPLAHERRFDLLYLTILARVFPNEGIYSETENWLESEMGLG
jgi:tetratricopeptide (TPR) repeat protein